VNARGTRRLGWLRRRGWYPGQAACGLALLACFAALAAMATLAA
jgi:hypothetical protein